jgi:hypothetical protein
VEAPQPTAPGKLGAGVVGCALAILMLQMREVKASAAFSRMTETPEMYFKLIPPIIKLQKTGHSVKYI